MPEDLRQLGEARIQVAREAGTPEEWQERWPAPKHSFAISYGKCWTFAPCYQVEDFAAEVGFWLDLLGFETNAFAPDFCMVMDPQKRFTFSVRPVSEERALTPPGALTLEFMVDGIRELVNELASRGAEFVQPLTPYSSADSPMHTAILCTPAGIHVWLWGLIPRSQT